VEITIPSKKSEYISCFNCTLGMLREEVMYIDVHIYDTVTDKTPCIDLNSSLYSSLFESLS